MPAEHPSKRTKYARSSLSTTAKNMAPVACMFEGVTFREHVDTKVLQQLRPQLRPHAEDWEVDQNRPAEHTHLTKWLRYIKKNTATVKYKRSKLKWGRVLPVGSRSLGSIRCAVRGAICGDNYTDIDATNCHPVMLRQICQALDIPCAALSHYVDNRADCLAQVQAMYREGIDAATAYKSSKTLFIKIMYGGQPHAHKDLLKEPDASLPACATNLASDITHISRCLQHFNPQMAADLKKVRKKTYNWDGSFLSYYCQEW